VPIVPPGNPNGPYQSANAILLAAKARLNEQLPTLAAVSGKLVDNTQAFSQQIFNNAWRQLQNFLANLGYSRLTREVIVFALPAVQTSDPGIQAFINWTNYFDGVNFWNSPVLPPDFTYPLKVWERWSGQNLPFPQEPMEMMLDGLPNLCPKQVYNCFCDWREDSLYLPGSLMTTDLRFRYVTLLPDIQDNTPVSGSRWFQQPVPIYNCLDAMAWYIVFEIANARIQQGDEVDVDGLRQRAENAARQIFNRDSRLRQRVTMTRQPLSGRGSGGGWGDGYWGY
jgi:hypothetical protein